MVIEEEPFETLDIVEVVLNNDNNELIEKDGRSDVCDCSELKVISNRCYNICCCANCGYFTCI